MYKLKFFLTRYAPPLYRWLGWAALVGAVVAAGAYFTAYFGPVVLVLAMAFGAVAALAATLAILVLNVVVAAHMHRGIEHFEAAYDAYRRANNVPDLFYEEMDLAEAAERAERERGAGLA
jgi:hypothetical protein